jgi:hypothetical protein
VVAALGDAWLYDGDPADGSFFALHADGRRQLTFDAPHNAHRAPRELAYVRLGRPGERGLRPDGEALRLPMDIDPHAAATAILHMPLEREGVAQLAPAPLSTQVRSLVGRLRLRFASVGAILDEVVRMEGQTPVIDAHGPFGDATAVVDPDGRVRLSVHGLDVDIAAAVIGALATANDPAPRASAED